MTRQTASRWLAGAVAFFLPALLAALGLRLDRSSIRHDPTYVALVPIVMISSVAIAVLVPSVLIFRSQRARAQRIGLVIGVLCLLAVECAITIFVVLMEGLR